MDQIIEQVGNFGRFQALLYTACAASIMTSAWAMLFMVFGSYNPGWYCLNDGNSSIETCNSSFVIRADTLDTDTDRTDNNTDNHGEDLCELWRRCQHIVFYTESSSTIVSEWNLVCDNSWILSRIITVQMVGVLFGAFISGPVGERFGRRVSLFSPVALVALSSLFSAICDSWQIFTTLRFFMGIGIGGILSTAYLYPLEFVGHWWRAILSSLPSWGIGTLTFALVVYILRDWKSVHYATAVLAATCFLTVFWVPESIRWHAVNDRIDAVKDTIKRMSFWNKTPLVCFNLIEKTVQDINDDKKEGKKMNYLDLFRTVWIRKYSFKFGITWITMSLVYFTISFSIKAFSGDFYVNMIIFFSMEILPPLFVGPIANNFGRRATTCLFLGLCSTCCLGISLLRYASGVNLSTVSLVLANLSKIFILSAWGIIFLMSSELYPTVVRSLHSGFLSSMARIGGILCPYLIPVDDANLFISYIMMAAALFLSLLLVASVTEPQGKKMLDTIHQHKLNPRLRKGTELSHLETVVEEDSQAASLEI